MPGRRHFIQGSRNPVRDLQPTLHRPSILFFTPPPPPPHPLPATLQEGRKVMRAVHWGQKTRTVDFGVAPFHFSRFSLAH
jgi:hypothetical protein